MHRCVFKNALPLLLTSALLSPLTLQAQDASSSIYGEGVPLELPFTVSPEAKLFLAATLRRTGETGWARFAHNSGSSFLPFYYSDDSRKIGLLTLPFESDTPVRVDQGQFAAEPLGSVVDISPNGENILFSQQSGSIGIWVIPAAGGDHIQVESRPAKALRISNTHVLYELIEAPGIYLSVPVGGGTPIILNQYVSELREYINETFLEFDAGLNTLFDVVEVPTGPDTGLTTLMATSIAPGNSIQLSPVGHAVNTETIAYVKDLDAVVFAATDELGVNYLATVPRTGGAVTILDTSVQLIHNHRESSSSSRALLYKSNDILQLMNLSSGVITPLNLPPTIVNTLFYSSVRFYFSPDSSKLLILRSDVKYFLSDSGEAAIPFSSTFNQPQSIAITDAGTVVVENREFVDDKPNSVTYTWVPGETPVEINRLVQQSLGFSVFPRSAQLTPDQQSVFVPITNDFKLASLDGEQSLVLGGYPIFSPNGNYVFTTTADGQQILRHTLSDSDIPSIESISDILKVSVDATGAIVEFDLPNATDETDPTVSVSCLPASGTVFEIGTTAVECIATDTTNNTASTLFNVIVAPPGLPEFEAVADVTTEATSAAGAIASFSTPTAIDVFGNAVPVMCDAVSGASFVIGTTQVTCTATDAFSQSAQTQFSVNVEDTTSPSIVSQGDISINVASAPVTITSFNVEASDSVDGVVPVTCSPAQGSDFAAGTTTVTCQSSDATGNTSELTPSVTVNVDTPTSTYDTIIAELDLLNDSGVQRIDRRLTRAINHIRLADNLLQETPKRSVRAIQRLRTAIQQIIGARQSGLSPTVANPLVATLVAEAARISQAEIDDAIARGGNNNLIRIAQRFQAIGDRYSNNRITRAMSYYSAAAQRASQS